jgi:hypothetical protein
MKFAFLRAIPILIPILAGAPTASAAVNPALLALMPPDASVLFGVEVPNVLASPFGQFAIAQLPANNGMVQLAAATGFDYQHDLTELLGATSLPDGTKLSLVLARGNFQVGKFLALAAVTGSTVTGYRSAQIITLPHNENTAMAFLDSSTIAIGTTTALQAVIDRSVAHAQFSGPLAAKAMAASASGDAWIATVTPADQFMKPSASPVPGMLRPVLETSASVQFNNTGAVAAGEFTTSSAQQAQGLLAVARFLTTMAASAPKASANANAAQALALISAAQFAVNGAALDVTLPLPEQTLEDMYSARPKAAKKAAIR